MKHTALLAEQEVHDKRRNIFRGCMSPQLEELNVHGLS